jgi:hypothetical protein
MALLQKKYLRVNPLSNRTGNSFNSTVDFQFVNSGLDYVNWQETFLCVRYKVCGLNASGIRTLLGAYDTASGAAPSGALAWNAVGTNFKSATQMINSQVISRIDNCQQADTFVKRIVYSNAYRNTGVGVAQSLQVAPTDRDAQSAVYGEIELEWRPNFALFNQNELLPPTCLNQLSFEVASQWQKSFIQADGRSYEVAPISTNNSVANAYEIDVSVEDIYLRVCLHQMSEAPTDGVMDFVFTETQSSNQAINGTQQNLQYSVPPSTFRLGLFAQGTEAGFNTRLPPSLFQTISGDEKRVATLQTTYGSMVFPNPQYNLNNSAGLTGNLKWSQPYYDSMLASGRAFTETGLEDFNTWFTTLGPIFLAQFLKPADDRNTNVQVQISWNGNAPVNTNLWLMASFTRNVKLAYTAGQCSSVIVEDV